MWAVREILPTDSRGAAPGKDWHREDIKAAVRKSGATLRSLALLEGYDAGAFTQALRRPWPAVEKIIADHLKRRPQDIWPSRYDSKGEPLSRRRRKTSGRGVESHRQIGGAP